MLKFYKVDVSFSCDGDHIALQIKLSDYIGHKYVVLFFYPLDFTFVCPTGDIINYPFTFWSMDVMIFRVCKYFLAHCCSNSNVSNDMETNIYACLHKYM
jgi:hypothetical protein